MYSVLKCDNIVFDVQVSTALRINLMYDGQYYPVITKLTAATDKGYVSPACNKSCRRGAGHKCDASCDACSAIPPASGTRPGSPYDECNRHFRNATCFENHKH